jgi:hypothetical protein
MTGIVSRMTIFTEEGGFGFCRPRGGRGTLLLSDGVQREDGGQHVAAFAFSPTAIGLLRVMVISRLCSDDYWQHRILCSYFRDGARPARYATSFFSWRRESII